MGSVFFLLLLAVCGFVGAQKEPVRSVSAPVTRRSILLETIQESAADVSLRLQQERNREIALLQDVMEDPASGKESRENAAAQLVQIAERMELEVQSVACLEHMGYEGVAAVCGAQMISLIVPTESVWTDTDGTKALEAISTLTGIEAADIKIILAKK